MDIKTIAPGHLEVAPQKIPAGQMTVPVRIIANDYIKDRLLSDKSLSQAMNVATLPGIIDASLMMPDAHQGYGFPIGGVGAFSTKDGIISPGGIGFDINCGVRLFATSLTQNQIQPKLAQVLDAIYARVPVGQGGESSLRLTHEQLDEVLLKGMLWAKEKGYATDFDVERTEGLGRLTAADPQLISPTAKKRGKNQVGTLGGGNHFIELQIVDEIFDSSVAKIFGITKKGQVLVMIHSGSRGIGHQTCSDYLRLFEESFETIASSLVERDLMYAPWNSPQGQKYFGAMCACANFAWVNRFMMGYHVGLALKETLADIDFSYTSVYDVAHNIAKIEEHRTKGGVQEVLVHRKGATRAFCPNHPQNPPCYRTVGHPALLPGSMGTLSYVLVGTQKAMELTFGSVAHGSGRVMSRQKAIAQFDGVAIADQLAKQGILVKAPNLASIADESPGVYKDSAQVVDSLVVSGIARKIVSLRPIGVIKG